MSGKTAKISTSSLTEVVTPPSGISILYASSSGNSGCIAISATFENTAARSKASIIAPRILLVSILKREVYV